MPRSRFCGMLVSDIFYATIEGRLKREDRRTHIIAVPDGRIVRAAYPAANLIPRPEIDLLVQTPQIRDAVLDLGHFSVAVAVLACDILETPSLGQSGRLVGLVVTDLQRLDSGHGRRLYGT